MIRQAKSFLTRLHRNDTGAMAVEKVLLIALIAIPLILVLVLFKTKIVGWFTGQADQVEDPGKATAG